MPSPYLNAGAGSLLGGHRLPVNAVVEAWVLQASDWRGRSLQVMAHSGMKALR